MKRDEWTFEYTAAKLADAALAQADFRQGRANFWRDKKAEVMEKIKATGLTVHEDIAAGLSNYSNTTLVGAGAHVMVDQTLQRDLNECVTKIRQHETLVRDYNGWAQVLKGNPEARVQLDHDDWMFFFGN